MRVTVVSNWYPPMITGSAYYTSNTARALAQRGHEVEVVSLNWGPEHVPEPADFPIHLLPVRRIPSLPLFYNLRHMGFVTFSGARRRFAELVDRFKPHAIHLVNHIFDTTFMTAKVARQRRIPLFGSITTPIQHQTRWKQWVMEQADRATLGAFGVKHWDGIVSLDRAIHYYVERVYGAETAKRSRVIPFGVRLESLAEYEDHTIERTGRPTILHVGHIHPFRNPVQLVRAMPHVLAAVPTARLVLPGRIELQEPVQAKRELGLTDDQVQFLGQTAHNDVVKLMKETHVYASWVTGPYHSLGTAPMEAMLCEVPVINDLQEDLFGDNTLRNDKNIVLVDSHDPRSIADGIIGLLTDEQRRQRIGRGGREFVQTVLDWDKVAGQFEQFYRDVRREKGLPVDD